MIPVSKHIVNESSGVLTSVRFHADAKNFGTIFNILRSQLYSDPELAVLREYSTNAVDAHVMANKREVPIRVTLPNTLESFLKIRDFGNGLTDDEVTRIFTSYAASTKRDSQEATGMLGIGCKSGFAYNDSFMVNSYRNGTMTAWNAFIDPSNEGSMSKMAEVEIDEPNGLEIVIPVKEKDIQKFHESAVKLFRFFTVLPDIQNLSQERENQIKNYRSRAAMYSGLNWNYYGDKAGAWAIMGNIPYPITSSVFDQTELTPEVRGILDGGIHITFNIGDLEFAASREALQYTPHTKKAILDALTNISTELVDIVTKTFSSCATLWDAKVMFKEVFDMTGGLYHLRHLFAKHVAFKGSVIGGNEFGIAVADELSVTMFDKSGRYDYNAGKSRVTGRPVSRIEAKKNVKVIVNDKKMTNGIMNRIVPLIEGQGFEKVYVFEYNTPTAQATYFTRTGFDAPLTDLSALPKEPLSKYYPNLRTGGMANPKHMAKEFEFNPTASSRNKSSDFWTVITIDPTTSTGVYLPIDQFHYQNKNGGWNSPDTLNDTTDKMKELGIPVPTIYGFKTKSAALALNNPNMVTLWDYIKTQFEAIVQANPTLEQEYVDRLHVIQTLPTSEIERYASLQLKNKDNPLTKFLVTYKKAKKDNTMSGKHESFIWFSNWFNRPITATPSINLEGELQAVTTRYPLLSYMAQNCTYEFSGASQHLVDYIELVDTVTP